MLTDRFATLFRLTAITACLGLSTGAKPGQAAGELLVMTEELYPHSVLREGKVVGASTEFVEAVLKDAGIAYRLDLRAWTAVMQTAASGNPVLLYPLGRTDARESAFQWIGQLGTLEHRIYKLRSRQDLRPQTLADLRQHSIAVVARDARQSYLLQNGITPAALTEVSDNQQAMRLLQLGRVDYVPIAQTWVEAYCAREQIDCGMFEATIPLGMKVRLFLAANPATPRETVERLRTSWGRLVENGSYQRMIAPSPAAP